MNNDDKLREAISRLVAARTNRADAETAVRRAETREVNETVLLKRVIRALGLLNRDVIDEANGTVYRVDDADNLITIPLEAYVLKAKIAEP
jgi:hypothetical protein